MGRPRLGHRRVVLNETKTGRRWHDLPGEALEVIDRLANVNDWIFARDGTGERVTYWTARKTFATACQDAGLTDVRLHDLRRTVATMAAASGAGSHVIRDLLGHKTNAMADRYVRHVGNPVREARKRIGSEIAAAMK